MMSKMWRWWNHSLTHHMVDSKYKQTIVRLPWMISCNLSISFCVSWESLSENIREPGAISSLYLVLWNQMVQLLPCWLTQSWLSYCDVTVVKYPHESHLKEKGFILVYNSRWIEFIMAGKTWRAVRRSMVTEPGGWLLTLYLHSGSRRRTGSEAEQ